MGVGGRWVLIWTTLRRSRLRMGGLIHGLTKANSHFEVVYTVQQGLSLISILHSRTTLQYTVYRLGSSLSAVCVCASTCNGGLSSIVSAFDDYSYIPKWNSASTMNRAIATVCWLLSCEWRHSTDHSNNIRNVTASFTQRYITDVITCTQRNN